MRQHLISVERGDAASIERAIRDFERLSQVRPKSYILKLFRHSSGRHYVSIETRLPGYYLNNLTAWLNDPPAIPEVSNACGWWVAGDEHWYVKPDLENKFGDTVTMVKPNGERLTVYLPENAIYPTTDSQAEFRSPPTELGETVAEFSIAIEDLESANNPQNRKTNESKKQLDEEHDKEGRSAFLFLFGVLVVTAIAIAFVAVVVYALLHLTK